MNDHKLVFWVRSLRVTVNLFWSTVSSPSSMRNTTMRDKSNVSVRILLSNLLFQSTHFTDLLIDESRISFVTIDSNTGGIIASIF
ncbi:uncharacterized protein YKL104W-A [Saccharomyces cerevisiae S288C]|uniref:Uncharacterized protein YKL104W-A n=1 Tax=Saccharomyces cerevisiae (strain ATCC 204508 / S288c) TaxID=559292 RepID=YK14A_YEAST|nr:uncharacterized protein YKL104W-A [Saccharomyces cerevisiae S288C]A0A8D9UGU6.1 RecName: Full=Uncharacterized protein YKL104W-A [Saccharomyces cerevisiae S288C]DAD54808.1 TPA: hypothetical protein YKL104W-A [Saccharomyces cerevisiae S288C]